MQGDRALFHSDRKSRKALLLGRNDDGALKYCWRFASDSMDEDGLDDCDVRRMRNALQRHEYETAVVGEDCPTKGTIEDRLRAAAHACAGTDHFLFYFSGHARLCGDRFSLVLAGGRHPELLHAQDIIDILQDECSARSKLVILDCCYAEDIARGWQPRQYDNLRFLLSTKSLVPGKEIAALRGGIFTHCLCEALTDAAHWNPQARPALVDADGHLYSDRLLVWLKHRIPLVGRKHHPDQSFPEPVGDSGQDAPFLVAKVVPQLVDPASTAAIGFPPDVLAELVALLEPLAGRIGLAAIYDSVCAAAGLTSAAGYRGPTGAFHSLGLQGAIQVLAAAWYRPAHKVELALVELAARVDAEAPASEIRQRWLRPTLLRLHAQLAPGATVDAWMAALRLGQTAAEDRPLATKHHLAVAIWPRDANAATHYQVEARLVDDEGQGDPVHVSPGLVALGEMPGQLARALKSQPVLERLHSGRRRLQIELYLPKQLLARDLDSWLSSAPDQSPPAGRYPLTVRSLARLAGLGVAIDGLDDPDAYLTDWRCYWERCRPCREAEHAPGARIDCVVDVARPDVNGARLLREGACILLLGFIPDRDGAQLDALLRAGAGALVWQSGSSPKPLRVPLLDEVTQVYPNDDKRPCLADLPTAILNLRADAWHASRSHTGHYHLLWDDPERMPRFTGSSAAKPPRLTSPF